MINEKITMVSSLEERVLGLCEIEEIAVEIEEADEIKSRTLDIQRANNSKQPQTFETPLKHSKQAKTFKTCKNN